jgi:hypothetical protein
VRRGADLQPVQSSGESCNRKSQIRRNRAGGGRFVFALITAAVIPVIVLGG